MSGGFDIVAAKSFGDLVIALTCVGRASSPPARASRVLLGAHLAPLYAATGGAQSVVLLEHGEPGVPSFFDIRKNGLRQALGSGLRLRRVISNAAEQPLLFDRLAWRERFLANSKEAIALPVRENIYLAYEELFGAVSIPPPPLPSAPPKIGVFPGSRLASKNLPEPLIRKLQQVIAAAGCSFSLLLLEGERPELERTFPSATILRRNFDAVVRAVRACDAVVSADSLPAHLAELAAIPVFVFSPVDNRYWLPRSAFLQDRWSLFDIGGFASLNQFLEDLKDERSDD